MNKTVVQEDLPDDWGDSWAPLPPLDVRAQPILPNGQPEDAQPGDRGDGAMHVRGEKLSVRQGA